MAHDTMDLITQGSVVDLPGHSDLITLPVTRLGLGMPQLQSMTYG